MLVVDYVALNFIFRRQCMVLPYQIERNGTIPILPSNLWENLHFTLMSRECNSGAGVFHSNIDATLFKKCATQTHRPNYCYQLIRVPHHSGIDGKKKATYRLGAYAWFQSWTWSFNTSAYDEYCSGIHSKCTRGSYIFCPSINWKWLA